MGVEALLLSQVITVAGSTGQVVTKQADGSLALEDAAAGGIGGSTGATDNAILRADGTDAATVQGSGVTISDLSEVLIVSGSTTAKPLCIKAAASQSANLTEWQNSSGVNLLRVSSSGAIQFGTTPNSITNTGGETSIRSDNGVGNNATFIFGATGGLLLPGAVVMGGSIDVVRRSGADVFVQNNTGSVHLRPNSSQSSLQADLNATAGETRVLLWDVDKGSVQRVSIGAADSGGAGYKVLRVPN